MAGGVRLTPRNSVNRRIQFFRVNNPRPRDRAFRLFDYAELCGRISQLEATSNKYTVAPDGVETACWLNRPADTDRLVVGSIRRNDFPLKERRHGDRGVLELLADEGLAEIIHVRFFPNNVVAADYNHFGPRLTRFRYFLQEKFPAEYSRLEIVPIPDEETMERFRRLERISLADIKVDVDALPRNSQDTYMDAIVGVADQSEAAHIELILRSDRGEHLNTPSIKNLVSRLLRRRERFGRGSHLMLRGLDPQTHSIEVLDLLTDRIMSDQRVLRLNERGRTVDSNDAFRALADAYNDVRGRLPRVAIV